MKKPILLFMLTLAFGHVSAQNNRLKNSQDKTQQTLADLLHKFDDFEVDSAGNITHKGKPITRIVIHDAGDARMDTVFNCFIVTTDIVAPSPKTTKITLNCRDYASELLEKIIPNTGLTFLEKINETDDYGDQVPHFSILPPIEVRKWYLPVNK